MKTNRFSAWIINTRFTLLCVAIVLAGVIEFGAVESLVSQMKHAPPIPDQFAQAPSMSIGDLFAAAGR